MNDIILSTQNGEPVASSRDVAKRFAQTHTRRRCSPHTRG